MTKRVAIIGAGPCGLSQLRAFHAAASAGVSIPDIVCYEKQADWGGLWNYTWRTGVDEYGEPEHSSMYRDLWSNGPKECLEFADYSFEEHFDKTIGSYPPRAVLRDYIVGRADKSDVRKYVRFNTVVRWVSHDEKTRRFTVTAHDLANDTINDEEFDHIIVAIGHFSTPNMPTFEGVESFSGRLLHSHEFRNAREFKDKDVLIVGGSYSAEDIGPQCHKFGARSVNSSYRTSPMGFDWPGDWKEFPLLTRIEGDTCHFKDGTSKRIDVIILCTGFHYHFPFLEESLQLRTGNRLWPLGLYKGIFFEDNVDCIYLGMQDQFYTFTMFDAQAWYARDTILGRITLPDAETMRAHSAAWRTREEGLSTDEEMIVFQGDYVKDLLAETDYPDYDVDGVNRTFVEWEHHKHHDITGYRNNTYRSLVTGNMQASYPTRWLDAMDDSMEAYLKDRDDAAE